MGTQWIWIHVLTPLNCGNWASLLLAYRTRFRREINIMPTRDIQLQWYKFMYNKKKNSDRGGVWREGRLTNCEKLVALLMGFTFVETKTKSKPNPQRN